MKIAAAILFVFLLVPSVEAQEQFTQAAIIQNIQGGRVVNAPLPNAQQSRARSPFNIVMNRAIAKQARAGTITRRQGMRLRIAMLSPAFEREARDLIVTQMYYGVDEASAPFLPLDADGKVEVGRIDWEAIAAFIERMIPVLLQLLEIFGSVA